MSADAIPEIGSGRRIVLTVRIKIKIKVTIKVKIKVTIKIKKVTTNGR